MTGAAGRTDVVVVGAGHNGLVAAVLLARAGLRVVVCEAAPVVGGAARTETPFHRVPGLRQSTGAYLLGLMPPELLRTLGLELPLLRRDPHYFLPAPDGRWLLVGAGGAQGSLLTERDLAADARLQSELAALRADLAPAWLREPLPVEETAERFIRPALRSVFVDLVRGSVADYLARFDFPTELVPAMYAATDGITGLSGGIDSPGSGHNFLVHNMGRLPAADGTWMIVRGGMGTVTRTLADAARAAGAEIRTGTPVDEVLLGGGRVTGVRCGDAEISAPVVLGACDPWRLAALVPDASLPVPAHRTGTTLKVNLALRELPRFSCLPGDAPSPYGATIHLLAQPHPLQALRTMAAEVAAGRLPAQPVIECYVHTTVDPSLQDERGHHSAALFVQSVPHGADWDRELDGYVAHLLGLCDRFAPGFSAAVADVFALPPPAIEARFGITGGHIFHVDNALAFTDRMPYRTGVDGLYAGSAGCHPAGSVIGAAGHNAARLVLADRAG